MIGRKRVLIIGGDGFIGQALKNKLEETIEYEAVSIDKKDVDLSNADARIILRQVVRATSPDVIVVLSCIKRQLENGLSTLTMNRSITQSVIDGLEEYSNRVIYLSSCAVYGEENNQISVSETSEISPTSSYGVHKAESEVRYSESFDRDKILIVRPPLIYGLNDMSYGPPGFLDTAKRGGVIEIWGDGNEVRDFLHVNDMANIIVALESATASGIYNAATGCSHSYMSIVRSLQRKYDFRITFKKRTKPYVNHSYDITKLRGIIGDYVFASAV